MRGEVERELERTRAQAALLVAMLVCTTEELAHSRQKLGAARVHVDQLRRLVGSLAEA